MHQQQLKVFSALHRVTQFFKKGDLNIIMEDFNAKVGNVKVPGVTGGYGPGDQ